MSGSAGVEGPDGAWSFPKNAADLHGWIERELGVCVPTRPLIPGHSSPFDYLRHAFFDGRERPGGEAAVGPAKIGAAGTDAVVWANRGGGKTFLAAVATLLDLVFKPGIEVRILGGSLDQARHMHTHLRGLFERDGLRELVEGRITEKRLRLANGSGVELLAQSQTSVRGTRVQKLRCDEVELFDPEVWEAAQLVTRSKDCGGWWVPGTIECLSTMHVPHGLMWRLVRSCAEPGEPGGGVGGAMGSRGARRLFKWGVVDVLDRCEPERVCEGCALEAECGGRAKARDAANEPGGHVSVSDAAVLKSRVSAPTWQAEMLSLRPTRRDCVLAEFDPGVHVRPGAGPGPGERLVAGMDFGIRAPTVVLWAVVEAELGGGGGGGGVGVGLRVIAERIVSGVTMDRHAAAIVAGEADRTGVMVGRLGRPEWIGIDPAGRQRNDQTGLSNAQVLKRAGLSVRDRRLGLAAGIELVRRRLTPAMGATRLTIDPACTGLIESMERYRYPSDRPESEEPVKDGSDHAVDALRYLIQNLDAGYGARVGWA